MTPTPFAIVGAGWRTEFFLRAAAEMPERFRVTAVQARDQAKARAALARWQPRIVGSLDELLGTQPRFVVVSVGWDAVAGLIRELVDRRMPVLAETPPARDERELGELYVHCVKSGRVQIAEQYQYQPLHAARIAIASSGRLGVVRQVDVSAAHGYHGTSLIRKLLGVGVTPVRVRGWRHRAPVVAGPGRAGPPTEERIVDCGRTVARIDFGERMGVFDFDDQQYFSYIRAPRVQVRGERGQIVDDRLQYLADFRTPIVQPLLRRDAGHLGNLEGYHHVGYLAGERWVYRNPFPGARLADDEIAVATCLQKMAEYADGGESWYGLDEGCHDRYLDILINRAAEAEAIVDSAPQPWIAAR